MLYRLPVGLLSRRQREHPGLEPWEEENARVILQAMGKLSNVTIDDMDKDNLREIVENVWRSRCLHGEAASQT
jgi:hypothetical protein